MFKKRKIDHIDWSWRSAFWYKCFRGLSAFLAPWSSCLRICTIIAKKNRRSRLRRSGLTDFEFDGSNPSIYSSFESEKILATLAQLGGCQIGDRPEQAGRRTSEPLDWLWRVPVFLTIQVQCKSPQSLGWSKTLETRTVACWERRISIKPLDFTQKPLIRIF